MALFLALGGGYAAAFSGSGSLQKGAKKGFTAGANNSDIRTLTGIGSIRARCTLGTMLIVEFHNSSGETLDLHGDTSVDDDVASGGNATLVSGVPSPTQSRVELFVVPNNGSKAPQAEVMITTQQPGNCTMTRVSVLALNTEQ